MSQNNVLNWNVSRILYPIINIKPYEYLKVIEYLKDYFSSYNYYKNIYEKIKDTKFDKELIYSELNDKVIREYIKCRPNIAIIVLYPKATNKDNKMKNFIKKLEDNGKIYYQKDIEVTYQMLYNIIYQQYINTYRMKTNQNIIYKINRLGMKPYLDETKKIKIIVFDPNDNIKIFGSSVTFKNELRDIFLDEDLKNTTFESTDDNYPRGHDYLHINDTFNDAIEYSNIFFNDNSINFLKKQVTWRFINFHESQKQLIDLKQKLYTIPIVEQYKFLVVSSGILSVYGIRELNDLDIFAMDDLKINKSKINEFLNKYDISYKYATDWTEYWEWEINERIKLFTDEPNYNEFILNQDNSFYFAGIKFLRLKYEIPFRALRKGRPAQIADLIIMRRLLNLNYQIDIPEKIMVYNHSKKTYEWIKPIIDTYILSVRKYLFKRYKINVSTTNILKWLEMTKIKNNHKSYEGGSNNNKLFYEIKNISENKTVYPTEKELIKMGYNLFLRYLSDNKPYIIEGEEWAKNNNINCGIQITKNQILEKNNNILRICSFNVHQFVSRCNQGNNPLFGNNLNIFETPRDINKFIDLFKNINADILCLQEVIPILDKPIENDILDNKIIQKINFEYLNKLMNDLGYKYRVIYDTNVGNFTKKESRDYNFNSNIIYSKYEIESSVGYQLFINRNISFIDIKINNNIFTIGNTHLFPYDEDNILETQNNTIKNIIENIKNDNIILCGDFNLTLYNSINDNEKYKKIKKPIIDIFNNTLNNTNITNFNTNTQTDYILLNKKSNIKIYSSYVHRPNISDHNPVITNFIIN
jgi:endonuclease/exonuclease/phosphatase family metal-dependent hydrolase